MKTYKPVFIIGCYRGGTSLLFRLLSESRELWSLYRESNHMWREYHRHPDEQADTVSLYASDVEDANSERAYFDNHYHYSSYNNYVLGYLGRVRLLRKSLSFILDLINIFNYLWKSVFVGEYRFVDKTPPNAYRIGFLEALYPDAKFIHITRDGASNTSSLIDAWTHKFKFKFPFRRYLTQDTVLDIKGYQGQIWKFSIPEDWQEYTNKSIEEVCAHQWSDAHQHALDAFSQMDDSKYLRLKFEDLLADPGQVLKQVCDFIEIDYSSRMQSLSKSMPLVNTESKPSDDKLKRNQARVEKVQEYIEPMQKMLYYSTNDKPRVTH